ncbi:MAG: DUF2510 domain-containing protein [Gordonibacter sp.]
MRLLAKFVGYTGRQVTTLIVLLEDDMANAQAGWYPDPSGDTTRLRYWDGAQWTENVANAQPAGSAEYGYGTPAYDPTAYTQPAYAQPVYGQPVYGQAYYPVAQGNDRTFALIAFIFCLLSTVTVGWLLVPLAWMIPMTVHCWGIYKGEKPNTIAFGVCTLIFLNFVGGICLLVGEKDL